VFDLIEALGLTIFCASFRHGAEVLPALNPPPPLQQSPPYVPSSLPQDVQLFTNDYLLSANGFYKLVYQGDGNLVSLC
jgi:hypothetical protein